MTSSLVTTAVGLTRLWTRLYTCGLPLDERQARRDEIDSDLWESQHDLTNSGSRGHSVAAHIVVRLALGVPHDVVWRFEQFTVHTPVWWMKAAATVIVVAAVATFVASASSPTVDLATGLQLRIMSSGWFDIGTVDGPMKVVPAISFTLKNLSDRNLGTLQVNAVFYRLGRKDAWHKDGWGTAFVAAVGSRGLAPGVQTRMMTLKAQNGYTSFDPAVLQGPAFSRSLGLDESNVRLFVKYESNRWTQIGEYPIAHQLFEP
jgi:hypothetical protein